jgi:hypothetical protein
MAFTKTTREQEILRQLVCKVSALRDGNNDAAVTLALPLLWAEHSAVRKTKKNPQQFPAGGSLETFQSFEIRSYAGREH